MRLLFPDTENTEFGVYGGEYSQVSLPYSLHHSSVDHFLPLLLLLANYRQSAPLLTKVSRKRE